MVMVLTDFLSNSENEQILSEDQMELKWCIQQFSSVAQSCQTICDPMNRAARQASLSITNSWSLPKSMSIESVMTSSRLILCHPLLLLPPILPSIRVFSNGSALQFGIKEPRSITKEATYWWSRQAHLLQHSCPFSTQLSINPANSAPTSQPTLLPTDIRASILCPTWSEEMGIQTWPWKQNLFPQSPHSL